MGGLLATYTRQVASKLHSTDARTLFSEAQDNELTPAKVDELLTAKGLPALPTSLGELRQAVARLQRAARPA